MFRGNTEINIDNKGRFAVPTKYRAMLKEQSGGRVVVTIDTDSPCLLIYPLNVWQVIEEKIQSLPTFNAATRRIQRLLIGHAHECELDAQGRVLLAPVLRKHAQIDKKLMLVGQGKKFEVWSETRWESECQAWLEQGVGASEDGVQVPAVLNDLSV